MLGLLFLGALVLYGLSQGAATSAPKLSAPAATVDWPRQQAPALGQGKHYYFTLPIVKPDAKLLASALSTLGFADVAVYVPKASLTGAPAPYPADWASSAATRIVGRWTGAAGAPLDPSSLVPLGYDTSGSSGGPPVVWASTEDFVQMHVSKPG